MRHTLLMAALACSISGFAAAQTYEAVAPRFAQDASQRQAQNQWHAIGNVHLADGKTVPAYAVSVNNPVDEGLLQDNAACSRKSCDLNVAVSAAQSEQLQALRISGIGWVLAPRGWKNIEAAVGVNGSQSLLLKSPDGRESITYYNSGACVQHQRLCRSPNLRSGGAKLCARRVTASGTKPMACHRQCAFGRWQNRACLRRQCEQPCGRRFVTRQCGL